MNAWLGKPKVFRCSTGGFIVSRDAVTDSSGAIGINLHLSRAQVAELRDDLTAALAEQSTEQAKAIYQPVVAECLELAAQTGPNVREAA